MKRKIIGILILVIIVLLIICNLNKVEDNEESVHNTTNIVEDQIEDEKVIENTISTEDPEIEELKQEYNITGENEIYKVETESDGRKVINVKPSVNFKVAFAGMIKKEKPNFQELDSIFETNAPKENGIWIKKEDREKILAYINNNDNLNCEYEINDKGYLQIKQKENANTNDQKIEKIINGDKQYIFCISSICYMVDTVTGEIIDNPYNELEQYQTYEYFKDEERMIIFITENKDKKMTSDEIFESVVELIDLNS